MKAIITIVLLALFAACENSAPELPQQVSAWEAYRHPHAPFQLSYPSYFTREEDETGIRLRYDDFPCVAIVWSSKEEAASRGLWPKAQSPSPVSIENIKWKKYIYNHNEGPFYMRTVSYVRPVNDKYLAVAFRTAKEPSPVEMQILKNVTWTKN